MTSRICAARDDAQAWFTPDGALVSLVVGGLQVNCFRGSAFHPGPTQMFVRRWHGGEIVAVTPVLGAGWRTTSAADGTGVECTAEADGVTIRLGFRLCEHNTWAWHVDALNNGDESVLLDVVHCLDVALAPAAAVRVNEYFVSQYLDFTPLSRGGERDVALAVRQNAGGLDRPHPWLAVAAVGEVVGWATDALQVYALEARSDPTAPPAPLWSDLPSSRLQHEHAMVALQSAPVEVAPGTGAPLAVFVGGVIEDHPARTDGRDISFVEAMCAQVHTPDAGGGAWEVPTRVGSSRYRSSPPVPAWDQSAAGCFPPGSGDAVEYAPSGEVWSWWPRDGDTGEHTVTAAKDRTVLRPHGHVITSTRADQPQEQGLTATAWMGGVFASQVTQGHASRNCVISPVRGYLGLDAAAGVRVFVRSAHGGWQFLCEPTTFTMRPDGATWCYCWNGGHIHLSVTAVSGEVEVSIDVRGPDQVLDVIVAVHLDEDAIGHPRVVVAERDVAIVPAPDSDVGSRFPHGTIGLRWSDADVVVGGDELLFDDGRSRGESAVTLAAHSARRLVLRITPRLVDSGDGGGLSNDYCQEMEVTRSPSKAIESVARYLPWLLHDARIHFANPRGLEQFSGGGWGTRDVCQGPVELFLALDRPQAVRDTLLRVFSEQRSDGDWPQSFGVFERDRTQRQETSHGDILLWPLLALGRYLRHTGDDSVLSEMVHYGDPADPAPAQPVSHHVKAALECAAVRAVPGTTLMAYGHGDWNDSLQPADPNLSTRMTSSWTSTLHVQALKELAAGYDACGMADVSKGLLDHAATISRDLRRLLMVDGVLAGYAVFDGSGVPTEPELLVHPRDTRTGLRRSSLAAIHGLLAGVSEGREQAEHLEDLGAPPLRGPDGVRLFDKPVAYHGGEQEVFQRAETATFFGREIGLMYAHAHVRYVEALAEVGEAEQAWAAFLLLVPDEMRSAVAAAAPRQSNCYYSSSDAAFADRYAASAQYLDVFDGSVALEGGWRVYSSGPGVAVRVLVEHLLGWRREVDHVTIDPVMPASLDGLGVTLPLDGKRLKVGYRVCGQGAVRRVSAGGLELPSQRGSHRGRDVLHVPVGDLVGARGPITIEVGGP